MGYFQEGKGNPATYVKLVGRWFDEIHHLGIWERENLCMGAREAENRKKAIFVCGRGRERGGVETERETGGGKREREKKKNEVTEDKGEKKEQQQTSRKTYFLFGTG